MKKVLMLLSFVFFVLYFVVPATMHSKYTYSYDKMITLNVSKPVYTVTFHSNDGSDVTATQNFVYGISQNLNANTFVRTNYVFDGWNTESNGSGTSYTDEELVNKLSSINNGNVDLYAKWRRVLTFSVTGNPNNWTNQNVTLTIVPDIANVYEYSFDGGTTWQNSASYAFSNNQTVNMKIRELDGFTSGLVSENITKIDKVAPVIAYANSIEYNADHTTKQVSTLITTLGDDTNIMTGVATSDDLSGVASGYPKCSRNGVDISSTSVFTNVGRYAISCTVQDNAGNVTTENREVLVRWPTGGRYVVKKTEIDGSGIVGTGLSATTLSNGLYRDNAATGANVALPFASKYYYTGPVVDNYLSFAGSKFRILNVATNDNIKVLGDLSDKKTDWGNSLQINNRKIYLSETYNTWSTQWWPNWQIYNNVSGESKYKVFNTTERAHLALATFYAGRFNKSDAVDISYTVYYEQTGNVNLGGNDNPAFEGYSAYPNVSDYLKASKAHDYVINIDDTQNNGLLGIGMTKRDQFNANSWIDMSEDQWTMNSKNLTSTDNDFWVLDGTLHGRIISRTFYYSQQYRVVFYITDTTILSGNGSEVATVGDELNTGPYTVQEDWAWFDSNQVVQ